MELLIYFVNAAGVTQTFTPDAAYIAASVRRRSQWVLEGLLQWGLPRFYATQH